MYLIFLLLSVYNGSSYDKIGNVSKVAERENPVSGESQIEYYYDNLNQLVRENNPAVGNTIIYQYDGSGNITAKRYYSLQTGNQSLTGSCSVKGYGYADSNWGDKLTSYDGKTITYDQMGNPISYMGKSFTWTSGRNLSKITDNSATYDFKYDDNGIRTQKVRTILSSGYKISSDYILDADKVINEKIEESMGGSLYNRYIFQYVYDSKGSPYAFNFSFNNTTMYDGWYFYKKNLQGDIIGILDSEGNEVVTYKYDTWGKVLSVTGSQSSSIGTFNPYRYRGYRYDSDLGLYYLQSRYYDPDTGRFVNADDTAVLQTMQGQVLGANLFTYCSNNPVMNVDPTGHLYISYSQIKRFVDWISRSKVIRHFSVAGGPAALKTVFKIYIPVFFSWVNGLGPVGWVIFGYICVNVISIAAGFATAYFSKKGVDFYMRWFITYWRIQ